MGLLTNLCNLHSSVLCIVTYDTNFKKNLIHGKNLCNRYLTSIIHINLTHKFVTLEQVRTACTHTFIMLVSGSANWANKPLQAKWWVLGNYFCPSNIIYSKKRLLSRDENMSPLGCSGHEKKFLLIHLACYKEY